MEWDLAVIATSADGPPKYGQIKQSGNNWMSDKGVQENKVYEKQWIGTALVETKGEMTENTQNQSQRDLPTWNDFTQNTTFHGIRYVSLRLRVQNAVPAQPCVGKLRISLVLLNFLHCNFRLWFKTP